MTQKPVISGDVMPNSQTVELPDLPRGPMSPDTGRHMAGLPLRGVTVLAVEDSRFASEALRLMCRRLGARLRRAESIHAAHSHLKLYRPTLVIVDLGLPDGRGEGLIREIVMKGAAAPVVLGTSGDPAGRALALAAGADGFLDKPLESFAAFHATMMRHLPDLISATPDTDTPLDPDNLALRDDLAHAAALIEGGEAAGQQEYLSGFLTGVARHAHDTVLAEAAQRAGSTPSASGLEALRALLRNRLDVPDHAFGPKG
jgi:CheY-like chemotaxis protein